MREWVLLNPGPANTTATVKQALADILLVTPPALKEHIESRWGVAVTSAYGSTEGGGVATTCGSWRFHIHPNSFIIEILDPVTWAPVPRGDVGVLVLTGLAHAQRMAQVPGVIVPAAILDRLAKENPTDLKPLDALGNILRARKRYAEAADTYTQALKLVPIPDKRHWSIFYSRGTCYERLKNWPGAEADLQKALQLFPDQPLALNYLGYSWVDQNRNLKQGMALIEKAVALKPDDGYIVDSLGWAHFKLGNYAEAGRFLERAVELKPQDPVLNDHLGDALWRVGREREAKFQWDQSLTLDPEPEGKAGHFRIVPYLPKDIGMDHPASHDLKPVPSPLLLPPEIDLGGRFGEREIAGPKPDRHLLLEEGIDLGLVLHPPARKERRQRQFRKHDHVAAMSLSRSQQCDEPRHHVRARVSARDGPELRRADRHLVN